MRAIPWRRVQDLARAGVAEADIIKALELPESVVREPEAAEKLRRVVATAHAKFRAELQLDIKRRGKRTVTSAGSVNALALQARAHLGWDQQTPPEVDEPDIDSARERLKKTLEKLATNRSEIEGRPVTWAELLLRQAGLAHGPAPGDPDTSQGCLPSVSPRRATRSS